VRSWRSSATWHPLLRIRGAEIVYHSAAYISLRWNDWSRLEAANIQGVRNVVEACRTSGVRRLVHFSSVHALAQEPLDCP
jgi:dihydroflavonol-4-reductase